MADITITGKKQIKTINKEFQEKFPYLILWLMKPEVWEKSRSEGGRREYIPGNVNLAEARTITPKKTSEISIHGRTKIKTLEDNFVKEYGLHVQIGYSTKEGNLYYTSDNEDNMSLTQLNKLMEERGMQKKPRPSTY